MQYYALDDIVVRESGNAVSSSGGVQTEPRRQGVLRNQMWLFVRFKDEFS